ncbi:DUF2170 family protein [Vibrio tritonius]|uniref:DUF2170 family protein n=1 Tax=Vibrio tritonius TaxID=1435069 RepID=UPI00315CDC40
MNIEAIHKSIIEAYPTWEIDATESCLVITNHENITAYLAVSGSQIIVETLLFPASKIKDKNALNTYILQTHKIIPLTTVGLTEVEGDWYYSAFGTLSSQSKLESVVIEVETLFNNVEELITMYEDFIL